MQLRLDLVETPAPPAALWDALGGEQQAAVVAVLAPPDRQGADPPTLHEAEEADDAW